MKHIAVCFLDEVVTLAVQVLHSFWQCSNSVILIYYHLNKAFVEICELI